MVIHLARDLESVFPQNLPRQLYLKERSPIWVKMLQIFNKIVCNSVGPDQTAHVQSLSVKRFAYQWSTLVNKPQEQR